MQDRDHLHVAVLPLDRAFEILRREWSEDSVAATADPTLSDAYLRIWWRYFGTPGSESILALLTPAERVVGLLFTRLETERYGRLPVRVIRCWVNGHAQRAGLFLRCDPDAAALAIAGYWVANRRGWDLLRLQGLPEGEFADALLRHARALRCRGAVVRRWAHSLINIEEPWDRYLRGRVSKDTRKEVERQGRRLAQVAAVDFQIRESTEAVSAAMEDIATIELGSWKKDTGEVLASQPAIAGFYQDVFKVLAASGMAAVAILRVGDAPICAVLGLRSERRLLALKTSFDERYAKFSPGSQLFKYLIEHSFCRGFTEFDFYGMMPFSQRWAKQVRRFVDVEVEGPTLRSRTVGVVRKARRWWQDSRQGRHAAVTL